MYQYYLILLTNFTRKIIFLIFSCSIKIMNYAIFNLLHYFIIKFNFVITTLILAFIFVIVVIFVVVINYFIINLLIILIINLFFNPIFSKLLLVLFED